MGGGKDGLDERSAKEGRRLSNDSIIIPEQRYIYIYR